MNRIDQLLETVLPIIDRNLDAQAFPGSQKLREQEYVRRGPNGYSQADLDEFQYGAL